MLQDLSLKFDKILKKVTGQGRLTEKNISDTLREIRVLLLDADVNFKVAKQFVESVSQKALGQEVLASISPGQLLTKIFYDELVDLLGANDASIKLNPNGITKIMVIGLQGSGKTTFCGKLAKRLTGQGRKPMLVAADIYRPAAIEQLKILGKSINIPVYSQDTKDARKIAKDSIESAKGSHCDTIIIDTAGRLHVDDEMMTEVADIKSILDPDEILFVVDSMTGQDAVNSAKAFHDRVEYDGIVLTKMDGDSKGGCALSIRSVVGKPIKYICDGEKLDAIDTFYPDRLASRILGKGDIISLVEKAQAQFEEDEAEELEEKIRKNQLDFDVFLKQLKMIKKMGSLSSLIGMIPGVGAQIKNAQIDEHALVKVEAIINSMTREERKKPKILNGRRRMRIARGSGTTIQDVNRLVKQFGEMQNMLQRMNKIGFKGRF